MAIDQNELARQLAHGHLNVEGAYIVALPAGIYGHDEQNPTVHAGFLFTLRGHAYITCSGGRYELTTDRVFHSGEQMTFTLEAGASGWEYALIHYSWAPSADSGKPGLQQQFVLDMGENPSLFEMLRFIQQSAMEPGPMQIIRSKMLFYRILYDMLTGARSGLDTDRKSRIDEVVEYIHHHYMEKLTLDKLASLHGMDGGQLSYWFNKFVGLFPIDYVIQYRMQQAKQMLALNRYNVTQIAQSVGYADPHYFSRLFKKHVGSSPSSFRALTGNCPPTEQESCILFPQKDRI